MRSCITASDEVDDTSAEGPLEAIFRVMDIYGQEQNAKCQLGTQDAWAVGLGWVA